MRYLDARVCRMLVDRHFDLLAPKTNRNCMEGPSILCAALRERITCLFGASPPAPPRYTTNDLHVLPSPPVLLVSDPTRVEEAVVQIGLAAERLAGDGEVLVVVFVCGVPETVVAVGGLRWTGDTPPPRALLFDRRDVETVLSASDEESGPA